MSGAADDGSRDALWRGDDTRSVALYGALLARHGVDPRALNWGGGRSQRRRFAVLARIGVETEASVLDVGCGLGDLAPFLRANGHRGRYTGVDQSAEMIAAASARGLDAGDAEVRFLVADPIAIDTTTAAALASEYVFASGLFYLRAHAPEAYLETAIERLFALARRGLAFNSLSTWGDAPPVAGEFRADPLAALALARRHTPWVTLAHDYHPGDFTVTMRRAPTGEDSAS